MAGLGQASCTVEAMPKGRLWMEKCEIVGMENHDFMIAVVRWVVVAADNARYYVQRHFSECKDNSKTLKMLVN